MDDLLTQSYAPPRKEESNTRVCSLVTSPHLRFLKQSVSTNQYAFILVRCGEIAEPMPRLPLSSPPPGRRHNTRSGIRIAMAYSYLLLLFHGNPVQ